MVGRFRTADASSFDLGISIKSGTAHRIFELGIPLGHNDQRVIIYSPCRAIIGSTFEAVCAGSQPARRATTIKIAAADTVMMGSFG